MRWLDPRVQYADESLARSSACGATCGPQPVGRRVRRAASNRPPSLAGARCSGVARSAPAEPATNSTSTDWDASSTPPCTRDGHWFGTDDARTRPVRAHAPRRAHLAAGGSVRHAGQPRRSASTWGATAGYLGGRVDAFMMRIVDILYALPFMFFVILLMVFFGRNIVLIFVAIGAVNWLDMARIVRGQTLSLKQREFVEAAQRGRCVRLRRSSGATSCRICSASSSSTSR